MTTRNEPSVGAFEFSGLFSRKAVKTPDQLMNDALQAFTDASQKLADAQAEINFQINEHAEEIKRREKLLESATNSHSRLERVKGRFAELLA